jgi:6-phosphogluconolactonase
MREFLFQDQETLVAELAEKITQAVQKSITRHGWASLAVSGGSTPQPLFTKLSQQNISWQDVIITLVDERWVDPADAASNERLVRQYLLQDQAAAATFIGLKNIFPTAIEGQAQCRQDLRKVPRPFTVLLLGMGHDGHTASLFPGSSQLVAATDMHSEAICMATCMATTPANVAHERMTLTLPTLLDADEIILHIHGREKKAVLAKAQEEGLAEDMPIRFILRQQQTPVAVYWAA